MQTTLLGLAIAFILALLAALVGPHFIDWSQFRPQFEREASRVIGLPVRVDGAIDARLLPTPSLGLRGVAIGSRGDANNVSVEKLDVEFSLGDLMRGEWRANDCAERTDPRTGAGREGRLQLGRASRRLQSRRADGRQVSRHGCRLAERHSEPAIAATRRYRLHRRGARAGRQHSRRGRAEGGRPAHSVSPRDRADGSDGNGQRVRVSLEPGARMLAADLDGVQFDRSVPRFEGSLSVSRPAPAKGMATPMPWRLGGKLKADPAGARLDQLEVVVRGQETTPA